MKEFAPQPESDDDFWGGENKAKSTEERTAEISKSPRPTETVADKVEPKTETITNGTNVPAGAIDYVPRQSQSRQSFRNRPGSARSIHSPRNSAQVTQPPPPKLLEKLPEVSRKSESSEKFSSDESQAESEADVKSPKYSEAFDSEPEDKMTQISKEKISVTAVKSEKKLVKKSPVKTVKKVAKESTSNSMQTSKSTEILTTKTSKKTKGENSSLKVRSLQDEITYLKTQLEDLSQENRTMKQIQKRQERQILHNDRTGAVSSDVHNVLETHAEETRYLREHLKKQQEKNRENDRILRERNDALQQALAKVKRLEDLLHKKGIDPKAKPKAKDAELLQTQLEEERKRSQHLEREKELMMKNHRHQLSIEVQRHKETQKRLSEIEAETEKLREKARRTDLDALYTSRGTTIRTKIRATDSRLAHSLNQQTSKQTAQKTNKIETEKQGEKKLTTSAMEEKNEKKTISSADSGRADSIKSHEGTLNKSADRTINNSPSIIEKAEISKPKSPEKPAEISSNNIDDILGLKRPKTQEIKEIPTEKFQRPQSPEQPIKKKDDFLDNLFSNKPTTPKNRPLSSDSPKAPKSPKKSDSKEEVVSSEQPAKSGKDLLDDLFGPKIVKRNDKADYTTTLEIAKPVEKKKPSSDVMNLFGSIDKTSKMPWD